jgi:hypothetical protein
VAALAFGLTIATWLLTHALRYGRMAIAAQAAIGGSWFALLVIVRSEPARSYLAVHPLAGLWSWSDPSDSVRLSFDAPWPVLVLSSACWLAAVVVLALRNLRSVS